ncbi:MAG: hypothetical protein CMN77_17305 [Spirochaetaceae bacterium]|nr:hypothetical protein [Spirochaetaceae bacterium]
MIRSMQPESRSQDEASQHDGIIRKHLGELVTGLINSGQHQRLYSMLAEHRAFIDDILQLIENNSQGNT